MTMDQRIQRYSASRPRASVPSSVAPTAPYYQPHQQPVQYYQPPQYQQTPQPAPPAARPSSSSHYYPSSQYSEQAPRDYYYRQNSPVRHNAPHAHQRDVSPLPISSNKEEAESTYSKRLADALYKYREIEVFEKKYTEELINLRTPTSYASIDLKREIERKLRQLEVQKTPLKKEIEELNYILGKSKSLVKSSTHDIGGRSSSSNSSSYNVRNAGIAPQYLANPTPSAKTSRVSVLDRLTTKPITDRIKTKSVLERIEGGTSSVFNRIATVNNNNRVVSKGNFSQLSTKERPLKSGIKSKKQVFSAARSDMPDKAANKIKKVIKNTSQKTPFASAIKDKKPKPTTKTDTDLDRDMDQFMAPRKLGENIVNWNN